MKGESKEDCHGAELVPPAANLKQSGEVSGGDEETSAQLRRQLAVALNHYLNQKSRLFKTNLAEATCDSTRSVRR